jgi:hypothetical protein
LVSGETNGLKLVGCSAMKCDLVAEDKERIQIGKTSPAPESLINRYK